MYLARKIDQVLADWKLSNARLPMVIKGPRQIGKTESIRRFAREHYESLVEINFVEEPRYRAICSDGFRADDIIKNISLIDPGKRFVANKTLIFFDEIQSFPNIATALKFFKEDGRFDVVCSGSLLGISYREIESVSVGSKLDVTMHSMDFEEFLWAKGYDQSVVDSIYEHVRTQTPFSAMEMDVFHRLFLDFCILGGMPAVIRTYIQNNSFEGTLTIQEQLLKDYEEDIQKYLDGLERTRVLNIFRQIPVQLARENKKFQVSKVARGARSKDYWGCVEWLGNAGIINQCFCLNAPELPIRGNTNPDKFKLYFHDTGLLVASLDPEAQEDLRFNKNLGVYKGALFENFVGTALVAQGYDLCYYKKENSTLEQDFFVRTSNSLVPIEVKASNNKAKSLNTLVQSDSYRDIQFGIKLCAGNIGFEHGVYTMPYFCAFVLRKWLKTL